MFSLACAQSPYILTPMSGNSHAFVKTMGRVVFHHSEWNMITRIDLNSMTNDLNNLMTSINNVEKICNELPVNDSAQSNCKMLYSELSHIGDKLIMNNDLIFTMIGQSRIKRGLIDGIGKLSKFLFGTLDNDDGEFFANKLNEMDKTVNDTTVILEKQTTTLNL